MRLVYDTRGLLGVTTVRPEVAGVLQRIYLKPTQVANKHFIQVPLHGKTCVALRMLSWGWG
jgi:hypothetical protein